MRFGSFHSFVLSPPEAKLVSGSMVVEGYAAIFDREDLGGDVIRKGAFAKSIAVRGQELPYLWQHNWKVTDSGRVVPDLSRMPLGKTTSLVEDDIGLRYKAALSDVPEANHLYQLVNDEVVKGASFGYDVPKGGEAKLEGGVRELNEIDISEVSAALWGMQPLASTSAFKTVDPLAGYVNAQDLAEALLAILSGKGSIPQQEAPSDDLASEIRIQFAQFRAELNQGE